MKDVALLKRNIIVSCLTPNVELFIVSPKELYMW